MTRDWYFEVVSAVQRFICETADAPFSEVIACGSAMVAAIPRPPSPGARAILRSELFALAIERGFRRHLRVRSRCCGSACVPVMLATAPRYWADRNRPPRDVFFGWLRQYCAELDATHPDPLADRAANWIRARVTSRLD